MLQVSHEQAKQRRDALIAAAKVEQRPLPEWCGEYGFKYAHAAATLRARSVPFKGVKDAKEARLLSLHEKGLDCHAIAKETGLSSAAYVYARLLELGATPERPKPTGNLVVGGKRMNKECPRVVKMIGDLKKGKDTAWMRDKWGVCRERVNQVRAYGIEAGLLP